MFELTGKVIACGGGKVALYPDPMVIRGIYMDHKKDGPWTIEDLARLLPRTLLTW